MVVRVGSGEEFALSWAAEPLGGTMLDALTLPATIKGLRALLWGAFGIVGANSLVAQALVAQSWPDPVEGDSVVADFAAARL